MKRNLGIAGVVATLFIAGVFLFLNTEKFSDSQNQTSDSSVVKDQDAEMKRLASDNESFEHSSLQEKKAVFNKEEVLVLQQRSQEVTHELDLMTEELALNLDNDEKRKKIEMNYQKLVVEQNQLAIQLVKANQQLLVSQ